MQHTSQPAAYRELFTRSPANPILTAADWPYPANSVFNAAACMYEGKTLLLARVEDRTGFSHLTRAVSADGVSDWVIDKAPTLAPEPGRREEVWGLEDPRIIWLPELEEYAVLYTAYSKCGPVVSLALTKDFTHYNRLGVVMPPEDKDATLFPRRIDGKWYMIHRPIEHNASHIWLSASPDLIHWGEHTICLHARHGGWWDAKKVGLSPPLLETDAGWLMLYHGVRKHASGSLYRLGLALLDHDDPSRVLHRSDDWVFGPKAPYERKGDVDDVVFPCGWIADDDGTVRMYYGGADTCLCLATAKLDDLLEYTLHCPPPDPEIASCL